MLGLTFEIPNLMSKNLKEEKKLFDSKKEAISKMEHVYSQIHELQYEF